LHSERPNPRSLLGIEGVPRPEIERVRERGRHYKAGPPNKKLATLAGRSIVNRFVEPSTRTRTSFEIAAKRLGAEVIPLDGGPGVKDKFGFTVRVPCGVVAAVCPFNFPLHLVCHKVGPALAAGNAVVVKPATDTPLMGVRVIELLLEAGAPEEAVHIITGPGSEIGDALVSDPRVRKVTFTGSRDIGERICKAAGIKKVTMELGSNAAAIVMPDADLDKVAEVLPQTAFANAGQVCISTQRLLATGSVYGDLIDALKPKVEAIATGDPLKVKLRFARMREMLNGVVDA